MIIALSGLAGAGKSTIKALLAERLGYKAYSVGDLRGKMALERGMTIDELNALGLEHDFTDKDADAYQEKLGKTEDAFVIDGWLSWHFIPHAIKIYLSVEPEAGAKRIYESQQHSPETRKDEPVYSSVADAKEAIAKRLESNVARYQKWYGVDFRDLSHYDLVVDTTTKSPQEVVETILKYVQEHQA